MGLDFSKLEKVKHHVSKIIARCPACAESGNDRKGEHLFIEPGGRFGCVVYPGTAGQKHRQRIFELVGIKSGVSKGFKIRMPSPLVSDKKVIQKNILGRLGHMELTHGRKNLDHPLHKNKKREVYINSVPAVPEDNQFLFTPDELEMLRGIDLESLKRIDEVKQLFNGTVMSVTDTKPY